MFSLDFRVFCLFFCISFTIIDTLEAVNQNSSGVRTSGKQTKSAYSGLLEANGGFYSRSRGNELKPVASTNNGSHSNGSSRGIGLSAWGIIAVIVTVIVGGMAAYYVAIFYPIVCRKQGKYDIMELTTV